MNYQEYSKRALAVAGALSHKDTVAHAALGLSSELAELIEEIELIRVQGAKEDTKDRIKKETGDILWYTNQMLDTLGQSFDTLAIASFYTPIRHMSGSNFLQIADAITNELGICIGHVADHAKRLILTDKPVPLPEMVATLARLWRALSTLLPLASLTWEEVFDANIEKLETRYKGNKFTVVGSESHRAAPLASDTHRRTANGDQVCVGVAPVAPAAANDAPTAPEAA